MVEDDAKQGASSCVPLPLLGQSLVAGIDPVSLSYTCMTNWSRSKQTVCVGGNEKTSSCSGDWCFDCIKH